MGLLPPSKEVIALKSKSAETHIKRVKEALKAMVFDLRYAALDACQSVIMFYYKKQPDAKSMPQYLQKLIDEKKLEPEFLEKFKKLNKLWKDIDHEVVKEITPEYVAEAFKLSNEIVSKMKQLLPKDIEDSIMV